MSNEPIKVLLVDDEPAARRGAALLLKKDTAIKIIGEAASTKEAIEQIRTLKPDLVLLDVQMPGGDGFDVLAAFPAEERPIVIFVTAYDRHALKAFEVCACDYLLKPYEDERFLSAVKRAKELVQLRRKAPDESRQELDKLIELIRNTVGQGALPSTPRSPMADRVLVKTAGETLFLKADEIDWIEADGDYMKFHVGGRALLMRETMSRLEGRLDNSRFVRIHRSVIVNIDRIRKLAPSFAGDHTVVLSDGTNLRLSRSYHDHVASILGLNS